MDRKSPIVVFVSMFLQGCYGSQAQLDRALEQQNGEGGGTDVITTDMPFSAGYGSRCVQGANGSYSHQFVSTKYDLDLDTPNDVNDLVYAPMSGTAYVHDDGSHGFGRHVNLDLHDGTYLIMGHLKEVFAGNGTDVAVGQILGFEGTTGNSTGDHVHFGRHSGDAKKAGGLGASLEGLQVKMFDATTGTDAEVMTTDAVCGLTGGHLYKSELPTAHWHPVGTFLKRPGDLLVFERTSGNGVLAYMNEDAFLSRGNSFTNVALISDEELACYSRAVPVYSLGYVRALRDSAGDAWILLGQATDPERKRLRVDETGVAGVLQSYGITAYSYDDIDHGADSDIHSYPNAGRAGYRDGTLLSQAGKSDVYVMNAGVAMPIRDWDTYLLMGFGGRDIIRVTSDELNTNILVKGNCATDTYCVTHEDVTTCGGNASEENGNDTEEGSQETGELPGDADTGVDADQPVDAETLTVSWSTPGNVRADWITIAGTYLTASGVSTPWNPVLAEGHSATAVVYSRYDATHGDRFRFSGAYGLGNVENWSCVAPFPPGILQGTVRATVNGIAVPVSATADPDSQGCQLQIDVP
jgi:hypothetical protein